jgi:hypothetical protein
MLDPFSNSSDEIAAIECAWQAVEKDIAWDKSNIPRLPTGLFDYWKLKPISDMMYRCRYSRSM